MDNFICAKNDTTLNASLKIEDSKLDGLLQNLSASKRETYVAFELQNKTVDEIATTRGIAFSTVSSYLEDAILHGLPINFTRLGITMEQIEYLENIIRQPPINSNIVNRSLIKEQVPDMTWDHLKIILALIRRKYGVCIDSLILKSADPSSLTQSVLNENIIESENKTRQLPNWLKRAPSEHDIKKSSEELVDKKSAAENENKKFKKKPKLNI